MKFDCLPVVAAMTLALSLAAGAARAQNSVVAPAAGASAPRATKPQPRPLTPAELRDRAASPADERPAGAVTPQLSVPLGRNPPPPSLPYSRAARRDAAAPAPAPAGGIDDAVARCEAQVSELARAECRATLARAGRKP